MTYLEAVSLIHDIEERYDVMSVKYKGKSIWSFLRLRLLDCVSVNKEIKISSSVIRVVIKSLLYGNLLNLFKHSDVWVFSDVERRKRVGRKMIHRISGAITNFPLKCLMIEKPGSSQTHFPQFLIEEKRILSESWLLLLTRVFNYFSFVRKSDIDNFDVLEQITSNYGITFDYLHYVRLLDAQKKSMGLFLHLAPKPKVVIYECPYSSMGYVWAFHEHNISVIEMQHGVINCNHNAYNARYYESTLNPDSICVYGIEEYNYFKKVAVNYSPIVNMTGLYMLEKSEKYFSEDVFSEYRKKYKIIAVVSGQAGFEEQLGCFIDSIASSHLETMFIYIPRHDDVQLKFDNANICLVTNVNIYEYLKWTDIHITISSTTCLEAHYFHKPTLFYDYQGMASSYYSRVLAPENAVEYVDSPMCFTESYNRLIKGHFEYKDIFVHEHGKRLYDIIKNYL